MIILMKEITNIVISLNAIINKLNYIKFKKALATVLWQVFFCIL